MLQRIDALVRRLLSTWYGSLGAFAIALALVYWPYIFGLRLFVDSDSLGLNYPFGLYVFTASGLRSGIALWNTMNFHGFPPFIGENAATGILIHAVNMILPALQAYGTLLWMNMTLGAFFFALLLRRYAISPLASWFGGLVYITSMWWNVAWPSSTMMPPTIALLLLSLSIAHERPLRSLIYGTLVLTYGWYSMHWIHLPLLWTTGGMFALYLSFRAWQDRRTVRSALPLYVIMFALSTLFALPKLLPALLYTSLSFRASGVDWKSATIGGITPFTLLNGIFPYMQLPRVDFGQAPFYVGIFGYACAALTLSDKRRAVRALLIGYVVIFLIAIDHSPLYWLIQKIPPFSFIRGEGRWLPVGNVALAALAGVGLDALSHGTFARMQKIVMNFLRTICAMFIVVSGVVWIALTQFHKQILGILLSIFDDRFAAKTSGLPLEHYHNIIRNYLTDLLSTFNPFTVATGVSLLALIAACFFFDNRLWKKWGQRTMSVLLLVGAATTLTLLSRWHKTISIREFPWTTQTADYIRDHPGPAFSVLPNFGKFLLLDPHEPTIAESVRFHAEMLVPNRNVWYNVESADYFDNMMSRRMGRLLAWIGSEQIVGALSDNLARSGLTPEQIVTKMLERKDVIDMLNIQTVVSLWPLKHSGLTLTMDSRGILPRGVSLYIYDNTNARPFAYFADSVKTLPVDDQATFDVLKTEKWPSRKSLMECNQCPTIVSDGNGVVKVTTRSPTRVSMDTKSTRAQWLVVSMNNLPGWTVLVDEKVVKPAYANLAFFGIPLEKGPHVVTLEFSFQKLLRESWSWVLTKEVQTL